MDATEISKAIESAGVVALIQATDSSSALKTARAVVAGGLDVLEVVLRTDAALEALALLADELPGAHIGAGTVLSPDQAELAIQAGASFLVSPGLDPAVVEVSVAHGIPIIPAVATATELISAYKLGLRTLKVFPAAASGGPDLIKALSAVFRDVSFMPTGGVNAANLNSYLSLPSVIGCGGSWLTPAAAVEAGDFDAITELAREARALAEACSK